MSLDNLKCFGSKIPDVSCILCEFSRACEFAYQDAHKAKTEDRQWKTMGRGYEDFTPGGVSPDEVAASSESDDLPLDIDKESFSRSEVLTFAAMLLRVSEDPKLSSLLKSKLSGNLSIAQAAKALGITRQALHKRIGDALGKLLGFKQRKTTDSALLKLTPREFEIVKRRKDGESYAQIADALDISKTAVIKSYREIASKMGVKVTDKNMEFKIF